MNDLRQIASSALLGTERSPLGALENPHLEAARQRLAGNASQQLLGVAVLANNMARAGQTPMAAIPIPQSAPTDNKPLLPEAASLRLEQLFEHHRELVAEWLGLAAAYRVPHRQIITLLDYGRQNTDLRPLIQPLLGERGRWLARQNPHWGWASGDTSSEENTLETWETGNKAARALAFAAIRQTNPEQARTLLEQVWKSEPADERKTFLAQFDVGLSDADEPFLEQCLDDRSKEVKQIAAGLLVKLPHSAFVRRMKARAEKLLKTGKKELEVVLPEWENEFLRDGLEKKSPLYNVVEKAYWWQTIISNVPAQFWQHHLKLEPAEILKRLPKEFKNNFTNAIVEQPLDVKWIEALIVQSKRFIEHLKLVKTLPLERREALIRQHFFGEDLSSKPNLETDWIGVMRHPWNMEFSQAVWKWVLFVGQKVSEGINEYFSIAEFALYTPLEALAWCEQADLKHLITELEASKEKHKNRVWNIENLLDQLKNFFITLETRAAMRKELQP